MITSNNFLKTRSTTHGNQLFPRKRLLRTYLETQKQRKKTKTEPKGHLHSFFKGCRIRCEQNMNVVLDLGLPNIKLENISNAGIKRLKLDFPN